jgi:hypothetical protein
MAQQDSVYRLAPLTYIHVLDNNLNVTRVVVGPCTFTRQDHERVTFGPDEMVQVPPRHYCIVQNPAIRDAQGTIVLDQHRQIKLRHGDFEVCHVSACVSDRCPEKDWGWVGGLVCGGICAFPIVLVRFR